MTGAFFIGGLACVLVLLLVLRFFQVGAAAEKRCGGDWLDRRGFSASNQHSWSNGAAHQPTPPETPLSLPTSPKRGG